MIRLDLNGFGWISTDLTVRIQMDLAGFWVDVAGLIGFGLAGVVGPLAGGLGSYFKWEAIPNGRLSRMENNPR